LQLIESAIFFLLISDVLSNQLFVATYRRDKISSRPEMLSDKISLSAELVPSDLYGTFAFDKPDNL
jgi:hypothetical protein